MDDEPRFTSFREADDDRHFYGSWKGGSAKEGGGAAHPTGLAGDKPAFLKGKEGESSDRFANYPESQAIRNDVNGWQKSKPWEMSDENLKAGKAPGIQIAGGAMGTAPVESHGQGGQVVGHAGYATDRNITLSPAVLGTGGRISETPDERNRRLMSLMHHEAGHRTGVAYADVQPVLDRYRVPGKENQWQIPGMNTNLGNGYINGHSLGEELANAYAAAMMYGTEHMSEGEKAFADAVVASARKNGFESKGFTATHSGPMSARVVTFEPNK